MEGYLALKPADYLRSIFPCDGAMSDIAAEEMIVPAYLFGLGISCVSCLSYGVTETDDTQDATATCDHVVALHGRASVKDLSFDADHVR